MNRMNGDEQSTADNNCPEWQALVRRYGQSSFFHDLPRVREDAEGLDLIPSRKRLWEGLKYLSLGVLFLWLLSLEPYTTLRYEIIAIITLFLVAGSIMSLYSLAMGRRQIRWSRTGTHLTLRFGLLRFFRVHQVTLAMGELQVDIVHEPAAGKAFYARGAEHRLLLTHLPSGTCIQLAQDELRDPLAEAYEALRRVIANDGIDESVLEIPLEDGRTVGVGMGAIPSPSAQFRNATVRVRGSDLAFIRPSLGGRVHFLVMQVIVMCGYILATNSWQNGQWYLPATCGLLGTLFVIGMLGLLGLLGGYRTIRIDLRKGAIVRVGREHQSWSLDQVIALQICSKTAYGLHLPYTAYQLNLVLAQPPGHRVCLMCYRGARALRKDAARLAKLINKPLLDNG